MLSIDALRLIEATKAGELTAALCAARAGAVAEIIERYVEMTEETEIETLDPTRIEIDPIPYDIDPMRYVFSAVAVHQNMPFSCPVITRITDKLFVGGFLDGGASVPSQIDRVVSLYPWGRYQAHDKLKSLEEFKLYDSDEIADETLLFEIADKITEYINDGDTVLVHCQAGLNRSGLISALVLMNTGMSAANAIEMLRRKRSPAVLCNQTFEGWLLDLDKEPF